MKIIKVIIILQHEQNKSWIFKKKKTATILFDQRLKYLIRHASTKANNRRKMC